MARSGSHNCVRRSLCSPQSHAGRSQLDCSYLMDSMNAERRGGIINVPSTAAFQPIPYAADYAASKAFVTSSRWRWHEELRPYGVPW